MYCSYCGALCGDDEKFCKACGKTLPQQTTNNEAPPAAQAVQPSAAVLTAQTNQAAPRPEPPAVQYKGFFTAPRIIALIGLVIFTVCCFTGQYTAYYYLAEQVGDVALTDLSGYVLALPFLMILNIIFDKSMVTVGLSGVHGRIFRFKLLIFLGCISLCALFITPAVLPLEGNVDAYYMGYTPTFYLSVIGCLMTIIAPFLVKKDDGTGIKPIGKLDYIWIVIVVGITLFLSYTAWANTGTYLSESSASVSDTATDTAEASKPEEAPTEAPTEAQTEAPTESSSSAEVYRKQLKECVESYNNEYCIYDVNKDGISDLLVRNPYNDTNVYYPETDALCATLLAYDIYVYANGSLNYAGYVQTDMLLYSSRHNGLFVYLHPETVCSMYFYDVDEDTYNILCTSQELFFKYKYQNNYIVEDPDNDMYYFVDSGKKTFIYGENIITESEYASYVDGIYALDFTSPDNYSQIENANFS